MLTGKSDRIADSEKMIDLRNQDKDLKEVAVKTCLYVYKERTEKFSLLFFTVGGIVW